MRTLPLAVLAALLLGAGPAPAADKVVKVFNWADYVDPAVLEEFTARTGIKVVYDTFDSNDILETKLLAGRTGYDVVVPTSNFLARQIKAGIFQPLDRQKLPNWGNLDPLLLERVAKFDPGNKHAFVYMWGTSGIAYDVNKIKERMPDAPLDSWRLLFDPEIVAKFADCGVYVLNAPEEGLPAMLNYMGMSPETKKVEDFEKAVAAFEKIRPSIRKFHSSETINALAGGDICLAMMWSGDAGIARARAEEAKNGVEIAYVIPKEGAQIWFDMVAMPKDAPSPDDAYAFMSYLMEPEVIAKISDKVTYANGNAKALPLVDAALRDDPNVYPPPEVMARLFTLEPYDARLQRQVTRLWSQLVQGR